VIDVVLKAMAFVERRLQRLKGLALKAKSLAFSSRRSCSGSGGGRQATRDEKIAEFSRAKTGDFVQESPQHEHPFLSDAFLQKSLKRLIDPELYRTEVEPDLVRFGHRIVDEIWDLGRRCELEPPTLRTSPWGATAATTASSLVTSDAWKRQKSISAQEGLIALAYPKNGAKPCQYRRLHQVAKLFMYSPASGMYSCPLAMTDGAAKVLKQVKSGRPDLEAAYDRLTSRDPDAFWTSGQWMTEKRGGSDVGNGTQTVAVPVSGSSGHNRFKLYGYKWFSSASDSDMTLTLARIAHGDNSGRVTSGSGGVSMFYLPTRIGSSQNLNNIEVMKLKNKLGTRQLPTAELLLDGCEAELVSEPGRGIASISPMLTVTRMHNVVFSVAPQRKILSLARDFARRRIAFGKRASDQPLHLNTLLTMETEVRGCTALMLELARLVGLEESGKASEQEVMLLRLLMPVAKAFTAKKAMANISEGLECFGGQGYIEDTGLPTMLRDAQVLPIWEGTTNIMALDVARAISKTNGCVLTHFGDRVEGVLSAAAAAASEKNQGLAAACDKVKSGMDQLLQHSQRYTECQVMLREFMFSLANLYVGALLIEHAAAAAFDDNSAAAGDFERDAAFAAQWATRRDLVPVVSQHTSYVTQIEAMQQLVYEGYDESATRHTKSDTI